MNKTIAGAALALLCGCAFAQGAAPGSSVTIYGSMDVGVTWVDNVANNDRWFVGSGSKLANRLGFRGREDLGGGWAAQFVIEHGFNVDDGTTTLAGRMWGRQSFVGIGHARYGTLTFGRQYDFLYAGSPTPLDLGALLIGGLAGASAGAGTAVDNHLGGVRYDNTIKWVGSYDAFTAGAMWGLGSENERNRDRMASATLNYRKGPLWVGGAYLRDNFSAAGSGNRISSLGVNWDVIPALKLVVNTTSAKNVLTTDRKSRNYMVQAGGLYRVTDAFHAGLMVGLGDTRNAADVKGRIRQIGAGTAYHLSRRTELYTIASHVRTSGSAGTAFSSVPGIGPGLRSSDNTQLVLKAGVRHSF